MESMRDRGGCAGAERSLTKGHRQVPVGAAGVSSTSALLPFGTGSHRRRSVLVGGEVKRPGPVGHVPIPIQKPGVALDENQLLHLPEPLLG